MNQTTSGALCNSGPELQDLQSLQRQLILNAPDELTVALHV